MKYGAISGLASIRGQCAVSGIKIWEPTTDSAYVNRECQASRRKVAAKPAAGVALIVAAALGTSCSSTSDDASTSAPDPRPPAGTFRIADEYEQSSNIVDCVNYDNGVTTIELVNTQPVRVTLTNNATQVNMIDFGGSGSSGPSLTYVTGSGASGSANVVLNGDTFMITGTAIAVLDDPNRPLLKSFEIVATAKCRQSANQAPATLPP
jgi:Mycobacterium 19 kDa lipoprotein antigen